MGEQWFFGSKIVHINGFTESVNVIRVKELVVTLFFSEDISPFYEATGTFFRTGNVCFGFENQC